MPVAGIANRMLETYPRDFNVEKTPLVRCIDGCSTCAVRSRRVELAHVEYDRSRYAR